MQAASGYAFTAVVDVGSSRVGVSGEFQAPDRIHEVITSPSGARAEEVLVGSDTFVRDPTTGKWRRSTTPSSATDPRTAFSVLQQAGGVSRSGERYVFSLPASALRRLLASGSAATAGAGSGAATLGDHAISSLQISLTLSGRPVSLSLQYSAVGTAPPVTAPVVG